MQRNSKSSLALVLCLVALAGCDDQPAHQADNYDELAPYYSGEIIAEFPEEMAEYRSAYDASGLPFATAEGEIGPTSVYDSKLLGIPYMPKGFDYPRQPDGRPLRLLAQINFADVPPLPDYPDSGILQFYISDDPDTSGQVWGLQFYLQKPYDPHAWFELMQSQDYFRVIWHEEVLADEDALLHKAPKALGGLMPIDDEAKLSFAAGTSYPPSVDYRFGRVFGAGDYEFFERFGEDAESVYTRYTSHITVHEIAWVGGYAFFTQSDPRVIAPDEDWQLLLEIQSSMSEG